MPDSRPIVLDLPLPPPVNKARRINWRSVKLYSDWLRRADNTFIALNKKHISAAIKGPYEAIVTIREGRTDLDAHLKALLDYLVRCEFVGGDDPKHLRKVTLEFGDAPEGARIELRPCAD